jgi:hypothetical protein
LLKPEIPWWEWIQDLVNVWDPPRGRRPKEAIVQGQWLGALGHSAGGERGLAAPLAMSISVHARPQGTSATEPSSPVEAIDTAGSG